MILLAVVMGLHGLNAFAAIEAASVNGKAITIEQVNSRFAAGDVASKRAALDELIKHESAVQEAKKMKLDQDPAVQAQMDNVLVAALLDRKVGPEFNKLTVSEAEAKNYYAKNPEMRTSHIYIALPSDDSNKELVQKATDKLKGILADIKAGKVSFAEAAQANSEDASSVVGGDMDYRMKDRMEPEYYEAAMKLKVGEMSGLVRTAFGLHIIRLTAKHTWTQVNHTQVKRIMVEEKRAELVGRYLNDLRQKAKVSVNDKAL